MLRVSRHSRNGSMRTWLHRASRSSRPTSRLRSRAQCAASSSDGSALAATLEIPEESGESSVWRGFAWSLRRDLKLAIRCKAELGVQLLFYVIVVTLFPLAVGAEPLVLRTLGPGVLWVRRTSGSAPTAKGKSVTTIT